MARTWAIGELAERAGVSVRALRHYDDIGLLTPQRSAAGHRRYGDSDVERLTQIVALRRLGLSLDEIRTGLDRGEALASTLGRQLLELEEWLADMTGLRDRLAMVVGRLRAGGDIHSDDLMTLIGDTKMLAEGKTKIIEDAGGGNVLIRSKDVITAGDGVRRDVLEGKAAASTRMTANTFELLERAGIPTHFVARVDDVTLRARHVQMIPLELVARRYAAGSFLERFPDAADGGEFADPVFEMFEKDDVNHDPLLEFDFHAGVVRRLVPNMKAGVVMGPDVVAGDPISEQPLGESRYADITPDLLEQLRQLTVSAFEVIENAWVRHGGVYVDFKIECGFDRETGDLVVADLIDSDSGRLRFDDLDMSKQAYRDGTASLPELRRMYADVAALTDNFV